MIFHIQKFFLVILKILKTIDEDRGSCFIRDLCRIIEFKDKFSYKVNRKLSLMKISSLSKKLFAAKVTC